MEDPNTTGTLKEKLVLLLSDKFLLALVVAAAGYWFSLLLQSHQGRLDYQRVLFENRRNAYLSILTQAKQARDTVVAGYGKLEEAVSTSSREVVWTRRLSQLRGLARRLSHGGGGAEVSWSTTEDALAALEQVERVRQENALYVSEDVDLALDEFLKSLSSDIEFELTHSAAKSYDWPSFRKKAVTRAVEAYESLRRAIRKSLRIEEMILG